GNLLGQYFTAIDFNLFDRHSLTEPQFGGNPWPVLYRNLRDNETLLALARENSVYAVYEGPALVMKAYIGAMLTDLYGDVPYFGAVSGKAGAVTPVYDAQRDIYLAQGGILDNLETAISLMDNYSGTQALQGDILYGGQLQGWVGFAHSLLIKSLLRISGTEEVSAQLQALANTAGYIQDNGANAAYDFTDGQPNNFRMANLRAGDFNLFVMSETMQEVTEALNDPRAGVLFRPADNFPGEYRGLLNGPDASQTSISVADYSLTGTIFREETGRLDASFITAWETSFLLAEAAERGLITGDAQAYYEQGVAQAFAYWGLELPADYLTTGNATYGANGADPIEQIITQKWLAHCVNGYEGWVEYRRTGFPALKTISASLNNDLIPVRLPYPADEQALNRENYEAATAENGNSINAPVWWDQE
ncbi:MAG TPA: SusD/RagB family nutrient-binding outer membrane lipoprotein, partial [Cytophagales bacterium]|nr:SusD/RagB family nutrient-binding outer membrane lipoprotein [Cytophagales bacterium]